MLVETALSLVTTVCHLKKASWLKIGPTVGFWLLMRSWLPNNQPIYPTCSEVKLMPEIEIRSRWITPMRPRSPDEAHRVVTPLELFLIWSSSQLLKLPALYIMALLMAIPSDIPQFR